VDRNFLGGIPCRPATLRFEHADADLFRNATYALTSDSGESRDPRVAAFVKILGKMGARPVWLGAKQHDYAVGLASHLPQLAAWRCVVSLRSPGRERPPITLAGRACAIRCVCGELVQHLARYVLTNREVLSVALDLFARRLDDLRERLGSRELEADFDAANELYKLLRSL